LLLGEPFLPTRIELHAQLPQEFRIGGTLREIPTATQQQRLIQRLREPVVPLLHVPVLVCLPGLNLLADQAVLGQ
jgi:hypothetical protein